MLHNLYVAPFNINKSNDKRLLWHFLHKSKLHNKATFVPLPPSQHPAHPPSVPAGGHKLAAMPDIPWSADGNVTQIPHWPDPSLTHTHKSARSRIICCGAANVRLKLKEFNQNSFKSKGFFCEISSLTHLIRVFIRSGGGSVHAKWSHRGRLRIHRLFVVPKKGVDYNGPLQERKVW